MSKWEKAIKRLQSQPKDFTWDELVTVMEKFGYELKTTGGSARKFIHPGTRATLFLHEPHPGIMKSYQMREVVRFLKQEKYIS